MPTYEYECEKCGYSFETFQKISDEPLRICPKCRGELRRLIGGGAGFIVKGGSAASRGDAGMNTRCGNARPCCGRSEPCDRPPCSS